MHLFLEVLENGMILSLSSENWIQEFLKIESCDRRYRFTLQINAENTFPFSPNIRILLNFVSLTFQHHSPCSITTTQYHSPCSITTTQYHSPCSITFFATARPGQQRKGDVWSQEERRLLEGGCMAQKDGCCCSRKRENLGSS